MTYLELWTLIGRRLQQIGATHNRAPRLVGSNRRGSGGRVVFDLRNYWWCNRWCGTNGWVRDRLLDTGRTRAVHIWICWCWCLPRNKHIQLFKIVLEFHLNATTRLYMIYRGKMFMGEPYRSCCAGRRRTVLFAPSCSSRWYEGDCGVTAGVFRFQGRKISRGAASGRNFSQALHAMFTGYWVFLLLGFGMLTLKLTKQMQIKGKLENGEKYLRNKLYRDYWYPKIGTWLFLSPLWRPGLAK